MKNLLKKLNQQKTWLVLANIFLVFVLIYFSNNGFLPFLQDDFIFFSLLFFLFALYRPGWAFLFFVGTIALENINLAPEQLGIMLRPFQLIGILTFLAVFCRFLVKRLNFRMPKFSRLDFLLIIFAIGSFLSTFASKEQNSSLKISVIIFSFLILYFLVRIFVQSFDDLKKIAPFFLSSALFISLYGVWQNIRFSQGLDSFEIMPGRPNATFTEPDWFGIYLVLCLAVIFSILYFERKNLNLAKSFFLFGSLVIVFSTLILTVSRSAWIGAFILYVVYATTIFTDLKFHPKNWNWKETAWQKFFIVSTLAVAIALVYFFQLTTFQLFERAASTSGMQKITIACEIIPFLPEKITNSEELEKYSCRQINLEEIEKYKSSGKFVTEILRKDPNVNIRKIIYQKSLNEIKMHPLLGIGWGAIGKTLGTDERGENLNSSNIFLEVWLGSGLLGILSFLAIWLFVFFRAIMNLSGKSLEAKTYGILLMLGIFALVVPNLFNAGIFLGILWIFWGICLV